MAAGKARQGIVKVLDILNVKDIYQQYWLYFVPGQSKIQNWFCKGYGHIAILTCDESQWYLIDPQPHRLKFEALPFKKTKNFPLELALFYKAKVCIKLTIDQKKIKRISYKWWYLFVPRFVSCVSIIQYILGIKLKGMTPYGVIKYLKIFDWKKSNGAIKKIEFIKES